MTDKYIDGVPEGFPEDADGSEEILNNSAEAKAPAENDALSESACEAVGETDVLFEGASEAVSETDETSASAEDTEEIPDKADDEEGIALPIPKRPEEIDAADDAVFEEKRNKLKKGSIAEKLYGKKYLAACFFVPAILMMLVYVAMQVFPFGDNSVLVLDLNAQYVYFLEKFRSIILEGGSFLYSFQRALGGEFMGIFAYYVASPLNLITLLFPKEYMTEALLTLFVLKCGLCGLTFGIFINSTHKRRRPVATVMFSTMYALCAFAVVMQNNMMWTDNIIALPLIMLGIERLITNGKFKLYVVFLALAVFSNFYIGYMSCIFAAIYFFVRYFTMSEKERNPKGEKAHFRKTFLRFAIFSIIAVMIAAVVLFTADYSLSFGKLDFSDPDFSPAQRFDFVDILSKIYFGSYDSVRPEGTPFIYAGMLMPLLAPLYFFLKDVSAGKKLGAGLLCVIFFISFNLTTADLFWHGFQRPNWLNSRFAYMFVMIALLMAYEVFIRLRDIPYSKVVACGGVLTVMLIFMQKMGLENLPDLLSVWASILIIGVYVVFLKYTHENASRNTVEVTAVVLAVLVSIEMFASGVANLYALDDDVVFSNRSSYRDFLDPYYRAVEYVDDDGFYRSEKLHHRKVNDNFAIGLNGITHSTSTLNSGVITLLNRFGFTSKSHWSQYVGGTALSDAFFGIKYLYINPEKKATPWYVSQYYELVATTEDGIKIYKNPYALSIGFGISSAVDDFVVDDLSYDGPFEYMNDIFALTSGNEDLKIWNHITMENYEHNGSREFNVKDEIVHKGYEKNSDGDATLTLELTAENADHIYMYIPTKWPRKVTFTVNGKSFGQYFTNDTHAIVDIGAFEEGEKVTVVLTQQEDKMYIKQDDTYFYSFDSALFEEYAGKLTNTQLNVTEHSETSLAGTVDGGENGTRILTTIPYDEGWHITIDGEAVEYKKSLDPINSDDIPSAGLISFDVPAGEHEFEMHYMSDSFKYGAIISVSGIVLFAAACVAEKLLPKLRAAKAAALPEPVNKEDGDESQSDDIDSQEDTE